MSHMISLSYNAGLIALPPCPSLGTEMVEPQWTNLSHFSPRWPCNDFHHALGRRRTSMRPCLLRLRGWSGGTTGEMYLPCLSRRNSFTPKTTATGVRSCCPHAFSLPASCHTLCSSNFVINSTSIFAYQFCTSCAGWRYDKNYQVVEYTFSNLDFTTLANISDGDTRQAPCISAWCLSAAQLQDHCYTQIAMQLA